MTRLPYKGHGLNWKVPDARAHTYVRTHMIRVHTHGAYAHYVTHVRKQIVRMHAYAKYTRSYVRAYAQYLHTFFVQVRRRKSKGTFPSSFNSFAQ